MSEMKAEIIYPLSLYHYHLDLKSKLFIGWDVLSLLCSSCPLTTWSQGLLYCLCQLGGSYALKREKDRPRQVRPSAEGVISVYSEHVISIVTSVPSPVMIPYLEHLLCPLPYPNPTYISGDPNSQANKCWVCPEEHFCLREHDVQRSLGENANVTEHRKEWTVLWDMLRKQAEVPSAWLKYFSTSSVHSNLSLHSVYIVWLTIYYPWFPLIISYVFILSSNISRHYSGHRDFVLSL
jgi:hypothetical protein